MCSTRNTSNQNERNAEHTTEFTDKLSFEAVHVHFFFLNIFPVSNMIFILYDSYKHVTGTISLLASHVNDMQKIFLVIKHGLNSSFRIFSQMFSNSFNVVVVVLFVLIRRRVFFSIFIFILDYSSEQDLNKVLFLQNELEVLIPRHRIITNMKIWCMDCIMV